MKTFVLGVMLIYSLNVLSQTLYIPSGTSGIGSSSNSNVGLGINGAIQKLDVNGNFNLRGGIYFNTQYQNIWLDNSTSKLKFAIGPTSPAMELSSGALKITGNVGIGCDPGATIFKIQGSTNPSLEFWSSASHLQIGMATSNGSYGSGSKTGDAVFRTLGSTNSMYFYIPNNNGDGLSSIGFGDDKNSKWFQIYNNKTVRISGKLYAQEIEVKTNVWSDYVFKEGYNLMTLNDVEEFINKNQHLPNVPSENEVKNLGVNVADMDATLLRKIEELTLYIIELDKENKLLKERIDQITESK